jgi:hypothetical protein
MSANDDGFLGGARLLATDARVAGMLLREGRDRACAHLFGVSRDDSGVVTVIALATLAHAIHGKIHETISAPGGPHASDTLIGIGLLSEAINVIAGEWSRETPVVPTVVVAAVVAHHLRPWARISIHDVHAVAHRIRVDFDRRYGHLIRPVKRNPFPPRKER